VRGWRYRVVYERAAGVGKTDGFKVESQGDDRIMTETDAFMLYQKAIGAVQAWYPVLKETPGK
jgi:hypothetical protein